MREWRICSGRWISQGLIGALLVSGCAGLQWQEAPPPQPDGPSIVTVPLPPRANPALVAKKMVAKNPNAKALIAAAMAEPRVNEDDLLYQMGLLLLSPEIADRDGAERIFRRLIKRVPTSPYQRAAKTLLSLLAQLDELESNNKSLREDMRKILDIDLESERLRRATP